MYCNRCVIHGNNLVVIEHKPDVDQTAGKLAV